MEVPRLPTGDQRPQLKAGPPGRRGKRQLRGCQRKAVDQCAYEAGWPPTKSLSGSPGRRN